MTDSSNICLSCGLCCDGTLIGFVQLERAELPAMNDLLDVEDENGVGFFLQPCIRYCDGCTIYSKRPKQCASFKCGLLKSVEQKELHFDSALETIHLVKQIKIGIEEKLDVLQLELKSNSFYFRMVELKTLFKKTMSKSSLTREHLELLSDIEALDSVMLNKFGVSI